MGIIERSLAAVEAESVLEVGLGMGGPSWFLAKGRRYRGYEPDQKAIEIARERLAGCEDVTLVNEFIPSEPDESFDALVALEVLEHIEDDISTLSAWTKWVKPGGTVVLSVPAHSNRFGPYDAQVGHFRRYEREQLVAVMSEAGLSSIEVRSFGMPLGFLLEGIRNRVLAKRLPDTETMESQTARSGRSFQPMSGAFVVNALVMPFRLLQLPFERTDLGIGYVAWGRV